MGMIGDVLMDGSEGVGLTSGPHKTRRGGTSGKVARARRADGSNGTNGANGTNGKSASVAEAVSAIAGTAGAAKASAPKLPYAGFVHPKLPELVKAFSHEIGLPVWSIIQHGAPPGAPATPFTTLDAATLSFLERDPELRKADEVALLLHSPGGDGRVAYKLARNLQRWGRNYHVYVPYYAKSAATLLSLGAKQIKMSADAELGPLDAQVFEPDREVPMSALDEVQSLERLQAFAMDAMDQTMNLILQKTGKSVDKVLPRITSFVAELTRPLFSSVDVVHYTQMSRTLKVAEAYAARLLQPHLGPEKAEQVARRLTASYPDHAFVIDYDEARAIGLTTVECEAKVCGLLREMVPYLSKTTAVGRIHEVAPT